MALGIVLAGGGTGGHIFPALALAQTIREHAPGARVSFIGSDRGLEGRYVPAAGFELDQVASAQVSGKSWLAAARGLAAAARGTLRARRLLRARGADLVIGVGGYASVPAVAAALSMRLPTALVEPNARAGRANRLLGRFARAVFVQFEGARSAFPPERVHLTGYPVRAFPEPRARPADGRVRLLVSGGSQGARAINRAVCSLLPELAGREVEISHQSGQADFEWVERAYAEAGLNAEVAPFFDDLPARLAASDVLVARSGAATVAELCRVGVAAILVPYPHAADDHQMHNARELERDGACELIPNHELERRLGTALTRLLNDPAKRARLACGAAGRARPRAALEIWERCSALAKGGRA
ncbi:MAG: undecaprenyldiphospho-muramoylpentapeptide beta-N-acetylglucosaminyltransferase [Proteobacteria bacterium]|nr:undecaprenyldiphospho-muramoylpentapeptide beta-N-acetylglucosaminyltransferase [Pseudomonadota bacterium]